MYMWIWLSNIDLRCFVARQFLLQIYALLHVKFSGLKMRECKKMTNIRYAKPNIWEKMSQNDGILRLGILIPLGILKCCDVKIEKQKCFRVEKNWEWVLVSSGVSDPSSKCNQPTTDRETIVIFLPTQLSSKIFGKQIESEIYSLTVFFCLSLVCSWK